ADMVILLYREGYYNPEQSSDMDDPAEIIVAKHRNGPTGTVKLIFRKEFTKFGAYIGERYML
nr:DnaB-like helicase C-terminal domain-containing protein [Synergistales bacterium]